MQIDVILAGTWTPSYLKAHLMSLKVQSRGLNITLTQWQNRIYLTQPELELVHVTLPPPQKKATKLLLPCTDLAVHCSRIASALLLGQVALFVTNTACELQA